MPDPPAPRRSWLRRGLLGGVVLLAGVPVILASSWPALLEGVAEKKAVAALERKFDVVELGCFELQRTSLKLCDVHLEKDSVIVDLEELVVDFQVNWGFDPQVVVQQVAAQEGTLAGELDDIKKLRGSGDQKKASAPSRLVLEGAHLELEHLELAVRRGDLELKGQVNASAPGPAGPIDLELSSVELLDEGDVLAKAGTLATSLALDELFPLEFAITNAEASYEKIVIQDVAGTLILKDELLKVVAMDLHGQTGEGQSWALKGDVDRAEKQVDISLSAHDIRPSQLPGAHLLPITPGRGLVSGNLRLVGSRKKVQLEGAVRIADLEINHRRLSREPVVINSIIELAGQVDLEARELTLERASIKFHEDQAWELVVSGRAHHAIKLEEREYEFELELENAPCQDLLEVVPPGLLPALENFELSGTTSVDLKVIMDMADPDASVLEGGLDIDSCKIEKVPLTVASLSGPFSHRIKMKSGQTVSRLLGRGALYYTPFDRIPASVPAAVLSTEDGGFWRHDGFIKSQFEASLKRNIELGTFRRGASTITMQMVKNVLLTQEKTVSRKLQELFLTWVIEEQLGKQRIMEIYLNVVEFGPGIYGIGDAADHYFGKSPLELTSLEAAFMATLLPRPVERHEMWCRGELTPKHDKYIRKVHRRMLGKGRISQEEYDEAEAAPVVFSRQGWSSESACLAAGREVAEGTHTQGALSGLLLGRPE